jgi:hypothetical protein
MKYSKGIMWLDDCRIPYQNGIENEFSETYLRSGHGKSQGNDLILNISGNKRDGVYVNQQGRFTPNLLVCDDILNDGSVSKSGFNPKAEIKQYGGGNFGGGKTNDNGVDYGDKGTNSRYYDLDKWFDKVIDSL